MAPRLLLPIVLALAFGQTAHGQVQTLWERTGPDMPAWFGTNTERGIAFGEVDGTPRLFVASRSGGVAANVIRVIDAVDGIDIGTLSSEGVSGGSFGFLLNDVAVSDDGIIFASNMVDGATPAEPFRVYRWDSLVADPIVVINFTDGAGMRLGDRITVNGSAVDNSLTIYAAQANLNQVIRFTTDDQGLSFDHDVITLQGITQTDIFPNVAPRPDGSFYFNAGAGTFGTTGIHPRLHEADGTHLATLESVPFLTNTTVYFEAGGRAYIGVNDGFTEDHQTFSVYDVTGGGASARFLVRSPSFGTAENIFGAGDLDIDVNEDGTFILFGLQANNGIAAYLIDPAAIFEGTYYVGAEGTGPGGANPDYASLAEAFADINEQEPTGPLNLLITSDLDELDDVMLLQENLTEDTPVVIRPAPGVTPTVTVVANAAPDNADAAGAGIAFVNVHHVTLDGSNDPEADSRDLTIVVNDEAADRGIGVQGDAQNIVIRNLTVLREQASAASIGIRVRRDDDATVAPENVLIQNVGVGSLESPFKDGVAFWGTSAPFLEQVGGSMFDSDIYATHRGITTFINADQAYASNRIHITGAHPNPAWYAGIYLAGVTEARVEANEIFMLGANTTETRHVTGIVLNVNVGVIDIFNNMISIVSDFNDMGTADINEVYGIGSHREIGDEHHRIYHNTIFVGNTDQSGVHAAFGFPEGVQTMTKTFDLKNNILINDRQLAQAYAIDWRPGTETLESDFNNFFVTYADAHVGNWGGTDLEALTDWQFASGLDPNSVSKAVEFVSEANLRLTGDSIGDADLLGVPLPEVPVDIDGNERSTTAPYMGAHEAEPPISTDDPVVTRPEPFELHQNYPNPFSSATTIAYTLQESGHVRLQIFNTAGQLVREAVDAYQPDGRHEVRVDLNDVASGVYIYRLQFGNRSETNRMVLVR